MDMKTVTFAVMAVVGAAFYIQFMTPSAIGSYRFHMDRFLGETLADSPLEPGAFVSRISAPGVGVLPALGRLPSFDGAVGWINSKPLTATDLKGKVVVVNFWTYACGDCVSALPEIAEWAAEYEKDGLVVIGVHSPEFAFEKNTSRLEKAVSDYGVTYPVAIDNDYEIWKAFDNNYWPEQYVVDADGVVRYHHLGAGDYEATRSVIESLLRDRNRDQARLSTEAQPASVKAKIAER